MVDATVAENAWGRIGNPMEDEEFAGVSQAMADAYARAGQPLAMHLDVTYRCDLECQHCYLDDKQTWPELNPAEMRNLLDQLHEAGTMFLVWSGGEVFLRSDFLDQLAYAAGLGFVSRIKTHGGNLTPERVAALARSRVSRVDLSIYSLDAAVHDRVTRRPGSLQATLAGLAELRKAGIPARVNVVIMPQTMEEISALWRFMEQQQVDFKFHTHVFRDHAGSTALDALDLNESERLRAERTLAELVGPRAHKPMTISDNPDRQPCKAGRLTGYVSPDGGVWPCVSWPMALGHLRERSFAEIWGGSSLRQEIVAWTNDQRVSCLSCSGSSFCSYCPGEAFKTKGDWRNPPAQFHAAARAKMSAFEHVNGKSFSEADWASVPDGGGPEAVPAHFAAPLYRPRKGRGQRVRAEALSLTSR